MSEFVDCLKGTVSCLPRLASFENFKADLKGLVFIFFIQFLPCLFHLYQNISFDLEQPDRAPDKREY